MDGGRILPKSWGHFSLGYAVSAESSQGKTVDKVASTWKIPAKYKGYAAPMPDRLKNNVQIAYDELNAAGSK